MNDWDVRIPVILWAYRTTYKRLTGKTTFQLVYGKEAIMPMEYIIPSLRIVVVTEMEEHNIMEELLEFTG